MNGINRIVIPVDTLSEASKMATKQGSFFAKLLNVEVLFVSVNEARQFMISKLLENKIRKEKEELLEDVKKIAETQGVNVTTKLMVGKPSEEIVKCVKEDDLIVMACHERQGYNKFFLGSVSDEVLRSVPCSVMIVKPTAKKKTG